MNSGHEDLRVCGELLPTVSRTFALTIRVLPGGLRETVTIAYLLCRLADVLEDATGLDPALRARTLERFADALAGADPSPAELSAALDPADLLPIGEEASVRLLARRGAVLRAFCARGPEERRIVARWVEDMSRGMATFVVRERTPHVAGGPAFRLETVKELRDYAYYVAGTVGHLLTELFQHHLRSHRLDRARLRELAVPFGLGLQFTNILQDLAEDRERGWSYVPEEMARRHGTTLGRLHGREDRDAALRVVRDLAHEAARNLDHAMEFTLLLPRRVPRIRLFCLWPIFFAVRTLRSLCEDERVLDGGEKVKISRGDVRRLIGMTIAACVSDGSLQRLYRRERALLEERLARLPVSPPDPRASAASPL